MARLDNYATVRATTEARDRLMAIRGASLRTIDAMCARTPLGLSLRR
jgi:hypothetical protein